MTTVYCTRCQRNRGTPRMKLGPRFDGQRIEEVALLCESCSQRGAQETMRARKKTIPPAMWPYPEMAVINYLRKGGLPS